MLSMKLILYKHFNKSNTEIQIISSLAIAQGAFWSPILSALDHSFAEP